MCKKALITGITGQDGSYLAELLLEKGYKVTGIVRRSSTFNTSRIEHLRQFPYDDSKVQLIYGDLTDGGNLRNIIENVQPNEVYHLGAQSHVRVSFDQPIYTANVDALGTLRLLEAIRDVDSTIKIYNAASSEMYGKVLETPQTEKTPFYPRSPYACSKVFSFHQCINYREAYGMFICNGILFNHTGPRRGETFVTRKITRAATRISLGLQDWLYLGNTEAKRDFGYVKDYVEAMWLMLQASKPDDYVIATGETHSIKEFLKEAFEHLELEYSFFVKQDSRYFRPTEVDLLLGDASKAKQVLGWEPKVKFKELIKLMVDSDMKLAEQEKILKDHK